jgi:uncharacterized repeat protein (TIGR01451 family)
VHVDDTLPAGTTFVTAGSTSTCTAGTASQVTCEVGAVAAGATASLTLVVSVPASANGTTVQNIATVAGTEPDPNTANNVASATTVIGSPPVLTIMKEASASTVERGHTLTYTITVSNSGGVDATAVTVTDPLPAGTTFESSGTDSRCTEADGTVTCGVDTLAVGASTSFDIVVLVATDAPDQLVNTATATFTGGTPVSASVTVSVTEELPFTGAAVARVAGVGLLLVDLGLVLWWLGRRRRLTV